MFGHSDDDEDYGIEKEITIEDAFNFIVLVIIIVLLIVVLPLA